MILLSASKVWLFVQRGGGKWSFLTWTNSHSSLQRHPETNREVVEETLLTLQKIYVTFSSNWTFPYQGGWSQFLISSKRFDSSICDWKYEFSIFFGKYYFLCIESFRVDFWCVHRLQLLKVCNQYVTLPNSSRVQSVSKEQSRNNPGKTFFPNWWILDWSSAEIG